MEKSARWVRLGTVLSSLVYLGSGELGYIGCASSDAEPLAQGDDDDLAADDDTGASDDDTGASDDDTGGGDDDVTLFTCDDPQSPYCVIEDQNLWHLWTCDEFGTAGEWCWGDYLDFFLPRAAPFGTPTDIQSQLHEIYQGEVEVLPQWPPGSQRDLLMRAMNMEFLLAGAVGDDGDVLVHDLLQRPLFATQIYEWEESTPGIYLALYEEWVLEDALIRTLDETTGAFTVDKGGFVGDFKIDVYFPQHCGSGPFPAVIGVHGHFQSAWEVMNTEPGLLQLVDDCMVVAAPVMRANDAEYPGEYSVTEALLEQGFNLEEIRVYEILLLKKWLSYQPEVDETRIGVVGHSGGAVALTLATRVEPFPVAVVDLTSQFFAADLNQHGEFYSMGDDNCPTLYPYQALIADLSTSTTASYLFDYGYGGPVWFETSSAPTIHQIFNHHLQGTPLDAAVLTDDPNLLWWPETP